MSQGKERHRFSQAEKTGLAAFCAAILVGCVGGPQMASLPLALFLLICLAAPFFPRSSFFLPVIWKGRPGSKGIALTFDDGPFPASTPIILELLARYRLPATFFVVGERAATHPELIVEILSQGHTIGNHSLTHDNLLMVRDCATLSRDIGQTQEILGQLGVRPRFFRPPIGIISPRLQSALTTHNLRAMTFSSRIFDHGNRKVDNYATRVRKQVKPGDILLLHDNPPLTEEQRAYWQQELEQLFAHFAREKSVVALAELIGQPVVYHEQEADFIAPQAR